MVLMHPAAALDEAQAPETGGEGVKKFHKGSLPRLPRGVILEDALARIVAAAGATLAGIAAVVEKTFEGGREQLAHWGVPIEALATITDMSEGRIVVSD